MLCSKGRPAQKSTSGTSKIKSESDLNLSFVPLEYNQATPPEVVFQITCKEKTEMNIFSAQTKGYVTF